MALHKRTKKLGTGLTEYGDVPHDTLKESGFKRGYREGPQSWDGRKEGALQRDASGKPSKKLTDEMAKDFNEAAGRGAALARRKARREKK